MNTSEEKIHIIQLDQPAWETIGGGIRAFNNQQAGEDNASSLCFALQGEDGSIHGGVIGQIFWDWLHVNLMWIKPELRRQGLGSRLLTAIESAVRERGACHAYLDSYSFQAPGFYEVHGYRVFGALDDYPQGHQLFFMQKDL